MTRIIQVNNYSNRSYYYNNNFRKLDSKTFNPNKKTQN